MTDIVIDLPMPPTTNNLFAGNGKRRYRTKEYIAWIECAGWKLASQRAPQIKGRVAILIELAEPAPNVRNDCANREKAVTDLLVTHGIIQGDDQRYVRENCQRWVEGIDGARVTIRRL
jgi:Holliday junction resolvase RusA-like endonuclease